MIRGSPSWAAVVECCHVRRIGREITDQHAEFARRQCAAVEVQQIEPVKTMQVSLYRIAMLIKQGEEAT
jgi:hypothetical protein